MSDKDFQFRKLYLGPSILAKQLEIRWFHHRHYYIKSQEAIEQHKERQQQIHAQHEFIESSSLPPAHSTDTIDETHPIQVSRMPFLRRSLSYIRETRKKKSLYGQTGRKRRTIKKDDTVMNNIHQNQSHTQEDFNRKIDKSSKLNKIENQTSTSHLEEEKKQEGVDQLNMVCSYINTTHNHLKPPLPDSSPKLSKFSIIEKINCNQTLKRKPYHIISGTSIDFELRQDMLKKMRLSNGLPQDLIQRHKTNDKSQHDSKNSVACKENKSDGTQSNMLQVSKLNGEHDQFTTPFENGNDHNRETPINSDVENSSLDDFEVMDKKRNEGSGLFQHGVTIKRPKSVPIHDPIIHRDETSSATSGETESSDESWGDDTNGKCRQQKQEQEQEQGETSTVKKKVNCPKNVSFYYSYFDKIVRVQREIRLDFRCPFCYFDGASDRGLLLHCKLAHGENLSFEGANDSAGNLHILVKNEKVLNAQEQPNQEEKKKTGLLTGDSSHLINYVYVADVSKKTDDLTIQSFDERKKSIIEDLLAKKLPIRQYYNSKTKEPKVLEQWDVDSDDESDDEWLHQMSEKRMAELLEENELKKDEYEFMCIWNRFIKSHVIIPDKVIPDKCREFVSIHGQKLVSKGLRRHLLMHLLNLWDQMLISAAHLHEFMSIYDGMVTNETDQR